MIYDIIRSIINRCSSVLCRGSCEQNTIDKTSVNGAANANECVENDGNGNRLVVASHNPKVFPRIWRHEVLDRVKTASRVVTKTERQRQAERLEEEHRRLEQECEERKRLLKDIDKKRQSACKKQVAAAKQSNQSDDGDEECAVKVLDRAYLAKQEEVSFSEQPEVNLINSIESIHARPRKFER